MNRRSFLGRILAAAVAAPALDKIVSAAGPKPQPVRYRSVPDKPDNITVFEAEQLLAGQRNFVTWEWTPLPDYSQGGVMDSSD